VIGRASVVSVCLLVGAFLIARASRTEQMPLREPLAAFPADIGTWKGWPAPRFDQRVMAVLGVDEYVNRIYQDPGGNAVSLYIGYYQSQREGDTIHSPLNCLPGAGWEPISRERLAIDVPASLTADAPDERRVRQVAVVNRVVIQKGIDRQVVLYWYQSHGRVIASEYWGKIYAVFDSIKLNRSDGAMVRLVSPVDSTNPASEAEAGRVSVEFARAILPLLHQYLPG
jgi:EpsI family protein